MASRYASSGIRTIRLKHPIGGLDRSRCFQDQPPFTTPDALNVFPADAATARPRIGQRPGILRAYSQQLGSGNPIRMLSSVSRVYSTAPEQWEDPFDSTVDSTIWATTWIGTALTYSSSRGGVNGGCLRTALPINTALAYAIEVDFTCLDGAGGNKDCDVYVFARYPNAGPGLGTDGCYARCVVSNNAPITAVTIELWDNAVKVANTTISPGTFTGGTLKLTINPDNANNKKATVNLNGTDYFAATVLTSANDATKQLVGLLCTFNSAAYPSNIAAATAFRITYNPTTTALPSNSSVAVASANGVVYADNPSGTTLPGNLTQITQASTLTLATDRRLMAVEFLQKLYIADHATLYNSTVTCDDSGANGTLTLSSGNWSDYGVALNDVVAYSTDSNMGSYASKWVQPSVVAAGVMTFNAVTAPNFTGPATISVRIERSMKIYDPTHATQQLSCWQATVGLGVVPHGCNIIAVFNSRIVVAGDPVSPNVWYMCRQNNPLDWDYSTDETDTARAVAGTTAVNQPTIGRPITALVPFGPDYLIIACATEYFMMRGDPARGGQLDRVSSEVGFLDRFGWCATPEGAIFFLAADGIRLIAPGVSGNSQTVSFEHLPAELLNVDTRSVMVSMAYDVEERGILIGLTPRTGGAARHWWLDVQNGGFWPVSFPTVAQPTIQCRVGSIEPNRRYTLHGGYDGYIRRFDRSQYYDDVPSLSISNKLISGTISYGPFGPSGNDNTVAALVHTVEATLAAGSGPIAWSVYASTSGEEVVAASTAFAAGTWTTAAAARRSLREMVRARGGAFIVKLATSDTTGASAWMVESLDVRLEAVGPLRT